MRIGIEVTAAARQGGGIGRYVRELLKALAQRDSENQYRLFFASPNPVPHPLPPLPSNFSIRHLPFHDIWLARLWHRAQLPAPVDLITGPIDIYHAPDFTLPPTRVSSLLTIHDLSFARDPESAAPGLRAYLNTVVPRSVRRASHIIAVSQTTKNDLIELYNTPANKITVVYEGVDSIFKPTPSPAIRAKYGLGDKPFIFSVSTLQPRKNFQRLIQAFARLPADFNLVIAGGKGWLYDDIFAEAEKPAARGRVIFPGFVPDADLPALYTEAALFAYPSLYEGFGLPLLEAMACGTPTVTSNVSCLPEVAGGAAVLVDPYSVESIATGLKEAATTPEPWVRKGLKRAAGFRWDEAASQLLALYQKLS
ncbi:MAG: glycosyltransferase family 4 protein [Chloroflexi bacterium]|nr:glycosyltransferase family 4 protein [Chloroflexota bacterium]